MRSFISIFNKATDLCIFSMLFSILVAGCVQNSDGHASTDLRNQVTPKSDIQQLATSTSESKKKPLLTDEERIAQGFIDSGGQFTDSEASCGEILKREPWCSVIKSVDPISLPEWELLFPTTKFYIVRTVLYGGEIPYPGNMLVVERDGIRYGVRSYQRLLDDNDVILSEENRELIARALVLMMLPDFIEYEVQFLTWEEGNWPSTWPVNFNFQLTMWTELRGYQMQWLFMIYEGELLRAGGRIVDEEIGDYIAVRFDSFYQPSPEELSYINR